MELRIFNHVIIKENSYFSFTDEGLIEEYEIEAPNNPERDYVKITHQFIDGNK